MKKLICLLLLAVLLLAGCGKKTETPKTPSAPQTSDATKAPAATGNTMSAPDFTVYDRNNKPVKLSDYVGVPIVLNFWASWCNPCKSEMPAFQKAYEELGDQVQFVMINVGELAKDGIAFIESSTYTFPVFFDLQNNAANAYQVTAIPATYFIGADGSVVGSHVGTMSESDLLAGIEQLR